ncbi:hypothetical protein [Sphingobacterium sp. UBA5670]|uniref:hypothetical protein n=1 Tax=Sphingobacterium sp. UBA5670 TaxID=1947502 RepID=UPI0025EB51B1|nr:hypothetical protein [Sphingobacterium sp. UBA5670]
MEIWQLEKLREKGFKVLYRDRDKDYFVPRTEPYEWLLETINETPLREDEIIEISGAIEHYKEYKELLSYIRVVYVNGEFV